MTWNKLCKCGADKKHNRKHDAYFCPTCDIWLEKVCETEEETCELCDGRPTKPSEVIGE